MAGIVILAVLASTYRNYRIKEGKAPYVRKEEVIPVIQALSEVNGISDSDLDYFLQSGQLEESIDYLTYGELKQVLILFPLEDIRLLEDYQKEEWYIGQTDWNALLMQLLENYGQEQILLKEQVLLGTGKYIKDESGNAISDGLVLTENGILKNNYWNLDEYMLSNVNCVIYHDRLLTIIGHTADTGIVRNVYFADVTEEQIHLFKDGFHMFYPLENMLKADLSVQSESIPRKVVDIGMNQGSLSIQKEKEEYVHGKLLQVSEESVEVEGYGVYPLDEEMEVYKLYGELASKDWKDLRIGYSFTDFVVEDGKIAACLMIKEEDMDSIRVLLKNSDYAGRYHDTFLAYCDQNCEVIYYENGMEAGREVIAAGESISFSSDMLTKVNDRIKIVPAVLSARTTIESIKRSQGTPVYMGTIEITKDNEGMILINEVLLEDYLYKVVPSEMPSSYPKEALMAQAVCARTYAYGKMLHAGLPQFGAHVDDSAGFQVYNNIDEQVTTTEAVKATHNTVAFFEGSPIGAYYYSTSSGTGTDTRIWHGGSEPPDYLTAQMITAQDENLQEDSNIEKEDSDGEAIRNGNGELPDVVTPKDLIQEEVFAEWIQTVNPSDYEAREGWYRWSYEVKEISIPHMEEVLASRYGSNPNLVLTKNEEGEFVSLPIGTLGEIVDIQITKRLAGGVADELIITGTESVIKVISELNIRYVLSDGVSKVLRQTNDEADAVSAIPSAFIIIEKQMKDDRVMGYRIIGGGFGHGVGMSQNGAKNMAETGMECEEILTAFYPGIELKTLQFE